jgi:hypothetical protein
MRAPTPRLEVACFQDALRQPAHGDIGLVRRVGEPVAWPSLRAQHVRAPEQVRGDQPQRRLPDAALAVDDRVLAGLADNGEDIGDLLSSP